MPRPKVRPEDRQRSSQACNSCKISKIRCDSRIPCTACIRRKKVATCTYTEVDRRRHRGVSCELVESSVQLNGDGRVLQSIHPEPAPARHLFASGVSPVTILSPSTSSDHGVFQSPQRQFPAGQTTEKECTTDAPSLSFLYFLRKTLRPFVGPTSFTEDEHDFVTQKPEIIQLEDTPLALSAQQLYQLLDSYFEATSGLLDLFTADEIDALVAAKTTETVNIAPHLTPEDGAALDVALAIGAQVQPKGRYLHTTVVSFILGAREVAFKGMLANPSIGMVKLFILLAFYMLGASQRNAASMYIGISARAAVLLRLHQSARGKSLSSEEYDTRSRIWNSLRVLDVLTSFILGRVPGVPDVWLETNQNITVSTSAPNRTCLSGPVVEGAQLIEKIVHKLRSGNVLHVPTAEALLADLRKWTQALPAPTKTSNLRRASALDSAERQALMRNIHISCIYYFAVMLITRPFLVAYLLSRLRGRAPDHLIADPDEATDMTIKNNIVSKLAQVCVSSATYMADMCRKAQQSGFSFGNLCLLKAWLFGSGLILGFSMFAGEPRNDIEDAFSAILGLLKEMAETCPQARSYHEILVKFSKAVEKYRQRVAGEVRRTVQHYMEQVLIIEPMQGNEQSHASQSEQTIAGSWAAALSSENVSYQTAGHADPAGTIESSPQWEDVNFQFDTPDLVEELEELEKLFYSVE